MNNIKTTVCLLFMGASSALYSQNIAINQSGNPSPNASAILDLSDASNNALGLLLTNVSLSANNSILPFASAPATGIIVWNTNAAMTGGYGTGFYYWDGAKWDYIQNTGTPTGVASVAGTSPIVTTGTATNPIVNIQDPGNTPGGVLYSKGIGVSAVYTPSGAAGSMLYNSSANTPAWLASGANGEILTISGGFPAWGTSSAIAGGPIGSVLSNSAANTPAWNSTPSASGQLLLSNSAGVPTWLTAGASTGSYLRNTAAGAASWSTLILPNAATTGDILYATGTNAIGNLSDVAAGSVMFSGGIAATPSWTQLAYTASATAAVSGAVAANTVVAIATLSLPVAGTYIITFSTEATSSTANNLAFQCEDATPTIFCSNAPNNLAAQYTNCNFTVSVTEAAATTLTLYVGNKAASTVYARNAYISAIRIK